MGEELSTSASGLRKRLDEAEVLMAVVLQLRKDLNHEDVPLPAVGRERGFGRFLPAGEARR